MAKYVFTLLLLSFTLQGLHIIEEPIAIKLYMVIVPIAFLSALIQYGPRFKLYSPEIAAFIFFIYMIFCSLWASRIDLSILKAIGILMLIGSYITIRMSLGALTEDKLVHVISSILLIAIVTSFAYYILGLIFWNPSDLEDVREGINERGFLGLYLDGRMPRMRGLYDSPNNFALMCVFTFFFYGNFKTKFSKYGRVLSALALLLTISATGWVALVIAYLIELWNEKKIREFVEYAVATIALISIIFATVPEEIIEPLVETRFERLETGSGREELFIYTLERIAEYPIFGRGLNQSRTIYDIETNYQSSHNSFLEAGIDGGLVAIIILAVNWYLYLSLALSTTRRTSNQFYFASAISLFIFAQANLLTFVELAIFYFGLWFSLLPRQLSR